jgi:type II secretory pathway pseudopilin PulG
MAVRLTLIEIVVALTVVAVLLLGSQALSERALRLLRWFSNRSEPPAQRNW